jgi:hypothetical protein
MKQKSDRARDHTGMIDCIYIEAMIATRGDAAVDEVQRNTEFTSGRNVCPNF